MMNLRYHLGVVLANFDPPNPEVKEKVIEVLQSSSAVSVAKDFKSEDIGAFYNDAENSINAYLGLLTLAERGYVSSIETKVLE